MMQRQLKGSLYYMFANSRFSLLVFWSILAAILLFTVIISLVFDDSIVTMHLSAPTYVFAAVMGYWIVHNTLPYIIKLGGTRASIYIAVAMYGFVLVLFNAIIANVFNQLVMLGNGEQFVHGLVTITSEDSTVSFNHIGDFLDNNTWITRLIIDTSISFFFFTIMFIIGLIFYRYGLIGGFSFLGIGMITFIFGLTNGWLIDFFIEVFSNFSIVFFYQLFVTGLLIYLFSYLFLRRMTV